LATRSKRQGGSCADTEKAMVAPEKEEKKKKGGEEEKRERGIWGEKREL